MTETVQQPTQSLAQAIENTKVNVVQIDPNQPIKFHVILLGGKKTGALVCNCGNRNQTKFDKYLATQMVKNEKGYLKPVKLEALLCTECRLYVPTSVLSEQYKQLTKV